VKEKDLWRSEEEVQQRCGGSEWQRCGQPWMIGEGKSLRRLQLNQRCAKVSQGNRNQGEREEYRLSRRDDKCWGAR